MKLSGISFRKCRGGIEAAREAPVRPEALPCPLCRLVFGGPPICSAGRAPRRFFAAFAVFGKCTYFVCGFVCFRSGKSAFFDVMLGIGRKYGRRLVPGLGKRRVFWVKISGFPDPPLVKGFYCAMVVLLAGLLTGKRCGFSSQRSSGVGGSAPFRRADAEKVGKNKEISRSDDQAMEGSRCRNGLWRSWSSTGISAFF
ncbi:hypothetical protein SAMN04488025_1372 [Planifilum fulgidum]|uniref:Uncharacterized protein n=1 Tax=Planifilum fulgidum TaxID=201973 RepID=A0A1I2S1M0_9BACL|nr:hypothetical protein SAMN04488025_1372 [Planifilum fulgidum]